MKRLFGNIGWLLGGRAINALLSLVYLALATRALGPSGFGQFALIIALGQAVTGFAAFQTWQFIVRWGVSEHEGVDPEKAAEATGFSIALDLLSGALGIVLAGIAVASAPLWLEISTDLLWLAFAYCAVSLAAIRGTPTGILRLNFRYGWATAAEAVQPVIRAAGAAAAFVLTPTVTAFVIAYAAAEIAVALALWVAAARIQPLPWSKVSLVRLPARNKDVWRFVISTNLSGSLAIAGKQVMILLVGTFGGAALAGGFRVASQLGQALVALAQTISKAILPELVHARASAITIARRMAMIAAIGGVIAVSFALAFGQLGLELIAGEEFGAFYWALVILALAGAIELGGASYESLLVSAGKAHVALILRAVPTVLAFLMLNLAIAWGGGAGAALTILASSLLAVLGFLVAASTSKRVGHS